jgi:hypothetical protein
MSEVTLLNGARVPEDSPEWAAECLERHRHIQTLRRMDTQGRRLYLAEFAHKHGALAGERLAKAYRQDWEARKQEVAG